MTSIGGRTESSDSQPAKAIPPKMPKLPTLNFSNLSKENDGTESEDPERYPPSVKQSGGPKSARGLATLTQAKLKSAMSGIASMSPRISTASKGTTPRFSIAAMLTPRTRNNLDAAVRSTMADAPAYKYGPLEADAGILQAASRDAPIGMSRPQMEGELLLARTDLMATKKEVHIVRMSHASLDRELSTAKGILARAVNTERDLRKALADAEATGLSKEEEVAALQQEVEALGFSAAETAAALEARKQELAAVVERLGDVTETADLREAELLQEVWVKESALRESVREQKETASSGRNQTLALQRKLEQEKSQRMADISRTTQTHASLIVEANDRIKRLERDLETAKGTSTQLASQLQEANIAAENGIRTATQAHAENTLLADSYDQLQFQAEQVISERDALVAQLTGRQPVSMSNAESGNSYERSPPPQTGQQGGKPLRSMFTGLLMVGVGALAGAVAQRPRGSEAQRRK